MLGRHHDAGLVSWPISVVSTGSCHPQTLRQARWLNAMLKESSAQVLVAG